jgi:hypothetical protein
VTEGSSAILPSPRGAISAPSMIFAESGPEGPSPSRGPLPNAFALGSEYAPGVSSVELVVGYLSAWSFVADIQYRLLIG